MNHELPLPPVPPSPTLIALLTRVDRDPAPGWEPEPALGELGCQPDLVLRLAEVSRPVGVTRRRFVAGCPVIEHPRGRPIAAAAGTAWLAVRSGMPAGALRRAQPDAPGLDGDWVELDPWAADASFARTLDLLRAHVATAYDLAEKAAA